MVPTGSCTQIHANRNFSELRLARVPVPRRVHLLSFPSIGHRSDLILRWCPKVAACFQFQNTKLAKPIHSLLNNQHMKYAFSESPYRNSRRRISWPAAQKLRNVLSFALSDTSSPSKFFRRQSMPNLLSSETKASCRTSGLQRRQSKSLAVDVVQAPRVSDQASSQAEAQSPSPASPTLAPFLDTIQTRDDVMKWLHETEGLPNSDSLIESSSHIVQANSLDDVFNLWKLADTYFDPGAMTQHADASPAQQSCASMIPARRESLASDDTLVEAQEDEEESCAIESPKAGILIGEEPEETVDNASTEKAVNQYLVPLREESVHRMFFVSLYKIQSDVERPLHQQVVIRNLVSEVVKEHPYLAMFPAGVKMVPPPPPFLFN
ncbi:hypothetical protein BC830DRAFT_1077573 [Chytriomyces sp. MP71]|nr:hypothetical protein BC830DRAFT_1077573 [Chytriomyces sp. MP71]